MNSKAFATLITLKYNYRAMVLIDYKAIGLKVGLEIHQQLDTHKLFCQCESVLNDNEAVEFVRLLRPAHSEMGEVDQAAISEAKKELRFRYQAPPTTCLVEADEEPPHDVNPEAVDISLEFAQMVDAKPVDEIQFMRKIVIDGSNTAGFQRTAIVALGGSMKMGDYAKDELDSIGISTISLEEDAARKVKETESEIVYRLDRLGIPLIEIATQPEIKTPSQAKNVALRIGSLLRATKKVKRGIGTIREDLNISISEGARVEIKGVQEPKLISIYVEEEAIRQLLLIEAKKELNRRNVDKMNFSDPKDLSDIFHNTKSNVLSKWLEKKGVILGIKLKGFSGLFSGDLTSAIGISSENQHTKKERRVLGPEMADYLKLLGIKGLFHSDELPGYGISEEEVKNVNSALNMEKLDGFVLVAEMEDKAKQACEIVIKRAKAAFEGVPEETRDPQPDGTTSYSRPLPGKARMYPETDVPPIRITKEKMEKIKAHLPELPEEKQRRFIENYKISIDWAKQLIAQGFDDLFIGLCDRYKDPKMYKIIGRVLLNTFSELESEGLDVIKINKDLLIDVFDSFKEGMFAKEGIAEILKYILEKNVSVKHAISELDLGGVAEDELEKVLNSVIDQKMEFIKSKGLESAGPLMGVVMKKLRGKVDGKKVNQALKKKIEEIINS
jgi:glutamyl-tRNA(Gln) amidotransferase subunit E